MSQSPRFRPGETIEFNAGQYGRALLEVESVDPAEKHMRVEDGGSEHVYVVNVLESTHDDMKPGTKDVLPVRNQNLRPAN